MEKTDARKHNQQTQYELRKQVVRLRKRGLANREVAGIVGISEPHASTIWQNFSKAAWKPHPSWETRAKIWSTKGARRRSRNGGARNVGG